MTPIPIAEMNKDNLRPSVSTKNEIAIVVDITLKMPYIPEDRREFFITHQAKYLRGIGGHRGLSAPLVKKEENKSYQKLEEIYPAKECLPNSKAIASHALSSNARLNFDHFVQNFWRILRLLSEVGQTQDSLLRAIPRSQPTW